MCTSAHLSSPSPSITRTLTHHSLSRALCIYACVTVLLTSYGLLWYVVALCVSPQFVEDRGCGVPLLVYSAMLTRGLDDENGCLSDMDIGGSYAMIGRHNYATQARRVVFDALRCAAMCCVGVSSPPLLTPMPLVWRCGVQEMVNLLLVGRAHSNVFDGGKTIPGSATDPDLVLRGIPRQCEWRAVLRDCEPCALHTPHHKPSSVRVCRRLQPPLDSSHCSRTTARWRLASATRHVS